MSESVLYRFTAYLMKAIKNERIRYCNKLDKVANSEVILDEELLDVSAYEQKYFQQLDQAEFLFEDEKLGISKAAMDKQYQRLLERIRKELMK